MDTEDVDDANDTTSIIAENSQKPVLEPPHTESESYEGLLLYISCILHRGWHWT